MILDDLLIKCMDNHAVENCQDCPERRDCTLLRIIHEAQAREEPPSLAALLPTLTPQEQAVVSEVEARYLAAPEEAGEESHPIRVPPFLARAFALLIKGLEWVGYGFMALLALILALLLASVMGWLLWVLGSWLLGLAASVLASWVSPRPESSPEPTPLITPSPGAPGREGALGVPWGTLQVITNQSGVRLRLYDEIEARVAPFTGTYGTVPAGPYLLQAEKAGFANFRAHVIVPPGGTTAVQVLLQQPAGRLRVRTRPPRAQVLVDGVLRGSTPADGPLELTDLGVGTHRLEASKAGYRSFAENVVLAPRHNHDMTLALQRAGGRLALVTRPPEAQVSLDGRARGQSGPDGRWQATVPAGSHQLAVRKAGYRDASPPQVQVEDGGDQALEVELEPLSGAEPPAAPEPSGRPARQSSPPPAGDDAPPPAAAALPPAVTSGGQAHIYAEPGPAAGQPRPDPPPAAPARRPAAGSPPDWPVYAGNDGLTGSRDDLPLRRGRLRWRARVGKISRAVAVGGLVYAGAMDGSLLALDRRDGRTRWRFRAGGPIWGSPVVQRGRLYFGSDDGHLYALDAASGRLLWRHRVGSPLRGSPSLVGGLLVAGAEDGRLVALRVGAVPAGARQAWTYHAGGAVRAAPVPAGDVVLVGTRASGIAAVDAATGEARWRRDALGWKLFSLWDTLGPVRVPISAGNGRVYVARTDNQDSWTRSDLHALDAATGDRVASGAVNGYGTAPVYHDGSLYLGSGDGHLYALDAETLQTRWRYNTRAYLTSAPSVAGGQVAFGCFDRAVYVLAASDGRLLFRFPTGGVVSAAPTMVDGTMYIGSEDGYLYAYE